MAWALLGSSQPRFDQDDVAIEPPAPGPTRVFVVDASGTHHALHVDLRETLRLFQERIEAVLECPASAQRLYVDRVAFRSGTLEANGVEADTKIHVVLLADFDQDAYRAKLRAKLRDAARSHGWKPSYGPLVSAAAAGRRRQVAMEEAVSEERARRDAAERARREPPRRHARPAASAVERARHEAGGKSARAAINGEANRQAFFAAVQARNAAEGAVGQFRSIRRS